jgi:hypothetical protein
VTTRTASRSVAALLESFGQALPYPSTDIHGAHHDETGRYWVEGVKPWPSRPEFLQHTAHLIRH